MIFCVAVGGKDEKVDLIFSVENTGNVGLYRQVIKYIMSRYHVSDSGVHVGIFTNGGQAKEVIPLGQGPQSDADFSDQVKKIPVSRPTSIWYVYKSGGKNCPTRPDRYQIVLYAIGLLQAFIHPFHNQN
jgi:hypothetical protein